MNQRFPLFESASLTLILLLFCSTAPIILLLIFSILQSRNVLFEQVQTTHTDTLRTYMTQIDDQLREALSFSTGNALYNPDVQAALGSLGNEAQYAKVRVRSNLENQLLTSDLIDGFFVVLPGEGNGSNFINIAQSHVSMEERHALQEYVETIAIPNLKNTVSAQGSSLLNSSWIVCSIGGADYLLELTVNQKHVTTGSYARISNILGNFSASLTLQMKNTALPSPTSSDKDLLRIAVPSEEAPVELVQELSRSSLNGKLPFVQQYTAAVVFLLLLVPFLIVTVVHRIYISPLQRLTAAMEQVESGNLDYRIAAQRCLQEFQLANRTFNSMLDQVQNLKIRVYEEELNVQRSRLRNLQLQVNPHFLINTLNTLYNLILERQPDLACELIHYAASYFRYMVKVDEDMVSLQSELEHVRSYLSIQKIRYGDHLSFIIQSDPLTADMQVPPMTIHCFVENSVKYALNLAQCAYLKIQVQARVIEKESVPYVHIIIQDSGPGYPNDYLPLLNEAEKISDSRGTHVGIHNTLQRIRLLFGPCADWKLYNQSGAVSELTIPGVLSSDSGQTV